MPSTGMPSVSLATMSPTVPVTRFSPVGRASASTLARARTSSVSNTSRHGTAIRVVELDLGDRPLVRDREHPQLGHLVAPELDAHRMFGGRREHVQDAAADRELAPLADHVDARVGQLDQAGDRRLEVGLRPDRQRHRFDVGEVGRHRLQQRTRRGDHHPKRRSQPGVVGMGQPTQHQHSRPDGFDARRQPFVRQRLPRREHRDGVAEDGTQFGGQVVGLTPGGGDDEQGARLSQRSGHEQPCAGRSDERALARAAGCPLDEVGEGRCRQRQVDEPRHRGLDMRVPRCGHGVSHCRRRDLVKIGPPGVKRPSRRSRSPSAARTVES